MSFQYPGTKKPQISDINFQVSLGSRIAVIGPNGAGKSTLVNVLTGELIPTSGDVYQHENIRIAYIKQHAVSFEFLYPGGGQMTYHSALVRSYRPSSGQDAV